MPESCTHLYVHLVWATWDRLPRLEGKVGEQVYAAIAEQCRALRCSPVAIGGMPDHIHLLTRLHATTAVASLAKQVKGASSFLLRKTDPDFRWQGSYGAFSLGPGDVPRVRAYVERQEEHHRSGTVWPRAELCAEPPAQFPQDTLGSSVIRESAEQWPHDEFPAEPPVRPDLISEAYRKLR